MMDQAIGEFLPACGATGPLILGVEEPGVSGVSWRVFDQPFVVVGRDPGADLVLKDGAVSRRHAYLQVIAGRLFCVDLQSRTGTRWGDEPGLWGWVRHDRGIGIGPFRLRPRDDGPGWVDDPDEGGSSPPVPVSRAYRQPGLFEATLENLGPPAQAVSWQARRALLLIGGSPSCKVRLEGGGVADFHASLLRTPSGAFVVDLLGPGGVLVNGRRARCARIEDDEIQMGKYRFRVRCHPPAESPPIIAQPGLARGQSGLLREASAAGPSGPSTLARFEEGDPVGVMARVGSVDDPASLVGSMLEEFARVQPRMANQFQETLMALLRSLSGMHEEKMTLIREVLAGLKQMDEEWLALRTELTSPALSEGGHPILKLVVGGEASHRRAGDGGRRSSSAAVTPGVSTAGGPASPVAGGDDHALFARRIAEIQEERRGFWQKVCDSLIGP